MVRATLLFAVTFALLAVSGAQAAPPVDFGRDVRPILSDKCFACHGPDENNRMANLRLDIAEGALEARGKRPAAVVPGDPQKSLVYQRITSEQSALRMPPAHTNLTLTEQQIEIVRRWIENGANYEAHWAYVPPTLPAVPDAGDWAKSPIDRFVLAKLKENGLKPSPRADKRTLLRRLSLDLTGLPPTPEELKAFLADESANAYEKAVDRLLASPHYGERMTMPWLDLARYADTHGYHIDSNRQMYHWRDWVIRAFNQNKPFNEFVVEQIAGDLLPKPTEEQLIATGFNRNHMINFEGGAIPEEYQTEYVVDRVETTSTVFLGMTMGCARCHDHKYDPIRQRDFYRFFAFFNTIPEKGLDGQKGNAMPMLTLPSNEEERRLSELKAGVKARKAALPEEPIAQAIHAWERTALETLPPLPEKGLRHHFGFEKSMADATGKLEGKSVRGELVYVKGRIGDSGDWSGETHTALGDVSGPDGKQPFTLAAFLRLQKRNEHVIFQKVDPATRAGWELWTTEGDLVEYRVRAAHLVFRMRSAKGGELAVRTRGKVMLKGWTHLTLTGDGSGKAKGIRFYLNGKPEPVEVISDKLNGPAITRAPLAIGDKSLGRPFKGGIDELRIYDRPLTAAEAEALAVHSPARALVAIGPDKRDCDQNEELKAYYLEEQAKPEWKQASAQLAKLQEQLADLEEQLPSVMIMREMEAPRDTFVLARGDYRNKTDKVEAGVPSFLPPLPEDAGRNRLGLAKWIVSRENPLTARVTVNRLWQQFFGTGIVETAEDFGSQGARPSHPDLLDWMAVEFMDSGWDMKGMVKRIVMSATYQQSSKATPELLEKDPENRLLARGPRYRLPAELVRDNALAASGLLVDKIGGPSVYPYQPPGLWEEMAYGDGFTGQEYVQSSGPNLYRRTMYTFWKRTVPPAALATFDAPDREKCTARRARTNTPLQALVLLNDPTYVEASRALAERVLTQVGPDPGARVRAIFEYAVARPPSADEAQILRDAAEKELTEFRRQPERARELLQVGESKWDKKLNPAELAAWTTVASMVLNLDEAISKQ